MDRLTNLSQNATQLYCIMIHLPFMFIDKKEVLNEVWPIMTSLLECMRILFSYTITENDIEQFEKSKQEHLSGIISVFKMKLKPKQHNSNHYSHIIRQMGLPRHTWMMRYEAKHKFFTDCAKKTNNFINITKSLAENHQSYICSKTHSYDDAIEPSKKRQKIYSCADYPIYQPLLSEIQEFDEKASIALNSLVINGNVYRKGMMVIFETQVSEIIFVLKSDEKFYLICHGYNVITFNQSLNSFKIEKKPMTPEAIFFMDINKLKMNETFERKFAEGSVFLIAENLEVLKALQ